MKYNLPVLSEDDFSDLHTFVQACFDLGRQRFSPTLKTVSNNWTDLPEIHHGYLAKCQSLGVAMTAPAEEHGDFHLWMTPQWETASQSFYNTLVHELVHGYAGLQYGHNAHWRRWLYRVRWHLNEAFMTPMYIHDLRMHCFNIGLTYNKSKENNEFDLLVEAFATAKEEHNQVMDNYWKRLYA